ncbi:MAG TPA: ATP-binding cassette domain-containing protein [Microbacterium sp.]|nr:ATP-binding cassette domain-containing protein [Microbacterium sp.]
MTRRGLAASFTVRRPSLHVTADFDVAPGTTLALVGPNGAGKSTVIAAVAGLLRLESGRIAIDDRIVADAEGGVDLPAPGRRVGVVFQDYLLFAHLDVRDNVAFAARVRGGGKEAARQAAQPYLDRFGLGELAGRYPGSLSGGQAQRVALARALAAQPEVLLLDEPMAALDIELRGEVRIDLARHIRGFAGATLLVTHSLADVEAVADSVAVIEAGRITQRGTLDELRAGDGRGYVRRLLASRE